MKRQMELVNITVKTYYRIRDSKMYGGDGSIGYAKIELEQCKELENLTEDGLEAMKNDIAQALNVSVDKVTMISKEEYEANTEEET